MNYISNCLVLFNTKVVRFLYSNFYMRNSSRLGRWKDFQRKWRILAIRTKVFFTSGVGAIPLREKINSAEAG